MKAQLHWVPGTDSYALYMRQYGGGTGDVRGVVTDGRLNVVLSEPGTESPPTLVIPHMFIEPLREVFAGLSITDGSGLNFLRDAVSTRDRLLTLVERLTEKT